LFYDLQTFDASVMTSSTTSTHEYYTAGQMLPWRWLRLPALAGTFGMSIVTIAVGAQAVDKSNKLEMQIKQTANKLNLSIDFDMTNIKATCIVFTIVASLLVFISGVFFVALAYDWVRYLIRPEVRRGLTEKQHPDDPPRRPFSTRTLNWQTILLFILTVWLMGVLIPATILSHTGNAMLTVSGGNLPANVFIDTRYWDYGFLRCIAAAPWVDFIFPALATLITAFAWRCMPTML